MKFSPLKIVFVLAATIGATCNALGQPVSGRQMQDRPSQPTLGSPNGSDLDPLKKKKPSGPKCGPQSDCVDPTGPSSCLLNPEKCKPADPGRVSK